MRHQLLTLVLGPLLLLQGRAVRRNTPQLPEPEGERSGSCGAGQKLNLLVLGDSAAAGVGVDHQDRALSGQLASLLGRKYHLSWELLAKTGATTASALDDLDQLNNRQFDVVLVSLGVNNVTGGTRLSIWLEQHKQVRKACREQLGADLVIVSGLPPMHGFPALPQPLRWYLGRRASHLNLELEQALLDEPGSQFLSLRFTEDATLMSKDGFHPGPLIYQEWAKRAVDIINHRYGGNTQ